MQLFLYMFLIIDYVGHSNRILSLIVWVAVHVNYMDSGGGDDQPQTRDAYGYLVRGESP